MTMSMKSDQEAPLRAKHAPAPSKKLTDTFNTATPEISAHSEAIALKRAKDANLKHLADQQREQDSTPSESLTITPGTLCSVSPAKRSRDESKADDNPSSDPENNSSTSAALEKPKSSTTHYLYTIILLTRKLFPTEKRSHKKSTTVIISSDSSDSDIAPDTSTAPKMKRKKGLILL